jgi:drug/metabolite transporter (DMT)-like permease
MGKQRKGCEVMKKIDGVIYTVASSAAFGVMPILAKIAYKGGTNAITVLFLRFFLAALVILPYIVITKKNFKINKKQLVHIIFLGIIGYSATTYTLFLSYNYISVGLSTTLHFIYPVIVTVFAVVLYKEKLHSSKVLALGLSVLGIYLLVGGGNVTLNFKGICLAIISGFFYAYYIVGASHSEISKIDIFVLTFYLASFAAISFFIMGKINGQLDFNMKSYSFLASSGIALVSTVLALTMFLKGMKIIGPSSASILSTLEPIVSIILGVIILKEQLSFTIVSGCVLILASVIILTMGQREKHTV